MSELCWLKNGDIIESANYAFIRVFCRAFESVKKLQKPFSPAKAWF